jgi:hypothetical protein
MKIASTADTQTPHSCQQNGHMLLLLLEARGKQRQLLQDTARPAAAASGSERLVAA